MAPNRSSDDTTITAQDNESNPFIAFRHAVDAQLNSIFGSVTSLPSTIYNRGADHSKLWRDHRNERLAQLEREEQEAMKGAEKQWESAMKDFEDDEREVKEWYDKVLRQITQRRDEHLESGMGFGHSQSQLKSEEEQLECPYLPPKEQRPVPLLGGEKDDDGCAHPKRWMCERDYPQSRFLDWVWTGWGGPSTSPDMLWHRGHKRDPNAHYSAVEDVASTETQRAPDLSLNDPRVQQMIAEDRCPAMEDSAADEAKPGPALSLSDPKVQQMMAEGRCPGLEDASGDTIDRTFNSLAALLLANPNSPFAEESSEEPQAPQHELEAFLQNAGMGAARPAFDIGITGRLASATSVQSSTTEQQHPDGTYTKTTTRSETFKNGQTQKTESVLLFDKDGSLIEQRCKTKWLDSSSTNDDDRALPSGWESMTSRGSGRTYYVDHNTKSTTWTHPSEGFVLPRTRDEFEQLVSKRFQQSYRQHGRDEVKSQVGAGERPKLGGGWFWKG